MLPCDCVVDAFDWYYEPPNDFSVFDRMISKRCVSCHEKMIKFGDCCLIFKRWRYPKDWIEENIYYDCVPIASYYMCGSCGEIFLNLHEIGYCLDIEIPMAEYLESYHEMTGFKK